jgi:uncharacterized membrane protein
MDFNEIQPNRELRACARGQLHGVWGQMALAYFIYIIIYIPYYITSTIDSLLKNLNSFSLLFDIQDILNISPSVLVINSFINLILTIAVLLTAGPFTLGFAGYFLKRVHGEEIAIKNIFDGFKRFFPSFLLLFFTGLFTALWSLLLIIPGIVKAFGYSMAFYIMHDNPGIKPLEALKRSQIMMKGYKFKLFLLEISFIGWMFLCSIFTLGIGYLWLYPYISLSIANFYENLKRNQENKAAETQAVKTPVDPFLST